MCFKASSIPALEKPLHITSGTYRIQSNANKIQLALVGLITVIFVFTLTASIAIPLAAMLLYARVVLHIGICLYLLADG